MDSKIHTISVVVTVILFMTVLQSKAQNGQPRLNLPSQNATSLGVFGTFPVSSATGVPDISIPIYNVNFRELSIPIELNYNTNLVKPDMHPGWVGLGWNMTAGGEITRTMNDIPDDADYYSINHQYPYNGIHHSGYFYNYGFFAGTDADWANSSKIQTATTDGLPDTYNPVNDYQPDEFAFSFLGYHGTFYLDETRNWKVRSDSYLKVEFNIDDIKGLNLPIRNANVPPGFKKFTITDGKGIKYVFGGSDESVEYSGTLFTREFTEPYFASTWKITSIILPNGESIEFSYKRGPATMAPTVYKWVSNGIGNKLAFQGSMILPSYLTRIETNTEKLTVNSSPTTELKFDPNAFACENYWTSLQITAWQQSVDAYAQSGGTGTLPGPQPVGYTYIIPGTSNSLDLNSLQWLKVDNIKVVDKFTGIQNKTINFNFTNDLTTRLKLQSITETGATGVVGRKYSLTYNSDPLPPYFAVKSDYWGYFNNTLPDYSTIDNFYASRAVNPAALQAEVLNAITLPTGGKIAYIFEPHKFGKEIGAYRWSPLTIKASDVIASGLRISKIYQYDQAGQVLNAKSYYYAQAYSSTNQTGPSTGVLGVKTLYLYTDPNVYPFTVGLSSWYPFQENSNGSNIAYSEVAEVLADGSYTVNQYSNFDNGVSGEYMDQQPFFANSTSQYPDYTSKAFERGKLLSQTVYSSSDIPLRKSNFTFQRLNVSTNYVRKYILHVSGGFHYPYNQSQYYSFYGTGIKIHTYPYVPYQQVTSDYVNGIPTITQTTTYTYDPVLLNLKVVTSQNSKGQIAETNLNYTPEMVSTFQDPTGVFANMQLANIVSVPIQTIKKIDGTQQEMTTTGFVNPYPGIFVPSIKSFQIGNNSIQSSENYLNYDALGNLLCESKVNGAKTAYQWGYQNLLPTVKAENAANTIATSIQSGGTSNTYINLPNSSTTATQQNLNIYSGQGTVFTLVFTGIPSSNTKASAYITIVGKNYSNSFTLCNSPTSSNCSYPMSQTISGIPTGTYTISATLNSSQNLTSDVRVTVNYLSFTTVQTGIKEFYFENFEDDVNAVIGNAHTGVKYGTTNTLTWDAPANGRSYVVSYWYLNASRWVYSGEQPYTGSVNSPYNMIASQGYDDIRIQPKDAFLTTYTYDPIVGMTSVLDSKGKATYYEYDGLQRLMNIKDGKGNILKSFCYNYAGQVTNCFQDIITYSSTKSVAYQKVCGPTEKGSTVTYTVTKTSLVSQADADQLAQAEADAQGQAYANANGTCTPILCYNYTFNPTFTTTYVYKDCSGVSRSVSVAANTSTTLCAQEDSVTGGPSIKGSSCQ